MGDSAGNLKTKPSGTDAAAKDMQKSLGGLKGTRVATKNFSGYMVQKSTVHPLNFSLAAVNPDRAIELFDEMVEKNGIAPSDPQRYSDAMDTIYSVFYTRHASPNMSMKDVVMGYGGVRIDLSVIASVLKDEVGTDYRRWVRGVSDTFYLMAITNFERFRWMFEKRQKELLLPTVEDAIAAMDGMDGCTMLSFNDVQRGNAIRQMHLKYQGRNVTSRIMELPMGIPEDLASMASI
jgi:hypothetical protein